MKKLVLMFVAVAAISFASCGNQAQQAPTEAPVDSVPAETVDSTVAEIADSAAAEVDSAAAEVVETVEAE